MKSCSIDSRNEQGPICEVVHETNKPHCRNLLPNRFLPSSVGRALGWWSGGHGFQPHWEQYGIFFCSSLHGDLSDNLTEMCIVKNLIQNFIWMTYQLEKNQGVKNSTLVTHKCCYPTPAWHPIICLVPHHPLSGTHLCLVLHPLSGTPPHVWNPITCLQLHPMPVTPSPVWYPIPCLISHPQCPTPPQCPHPTILSPGPLPHLVLAAPVWPLTAPYSPDLASGCPPSETLTPCHPPPAPTPTLSNIITKCPLQKFPK